MLDFSLSAVEDDDELDEDWDGLFDEVCEFLSDDDDFEAFSDGEDEDEEDGDDVSDEA